LIFFFISLKKIFTFSFKNSKIFFEILDTFTFSHIFFPFNLYAGLYGSFEIMGIYEYDMEF
jgi:hypothetical protein